MDSRKYQFDWSLLGDIKKGRPNLGNQVNVEIYRLMQFTFRDVMEQVMGSEKTDEVFYQSGKLAGKAFYDQVITAAEDINDFIRQLQQVLKEYGIGILRIEKADLDAGELILTVSEDLDCSGMPDQEMEICKYDEGFIAALLESYTQAPFLVKEIDCWCTGDRTCRFHAKIIK